VFAFEIRKRKESPYSHPEKREKRKDEERRFLNKQVYPGGPPFPTHREWGGGGPLF